MCHNANMEVFMTETEHVKNFEPSYDIAGMSMVNRILLEDENWGTRAPYVIPEVREDDHKFIHMAVDHLEKSSLIKGGMSAEVHILLKAFISQDGD